MNFQNLTIGFGMTASHCTHDEVLPQMKRLVELGANVIPVISHTVATVDSRFGTAEDWKKKIKEITGRTPLMTIPEVEPFGPEKSLDCYVIAPCTGNSLAKLANALTDSPVLMAAKAQMRNHRPVVVAISTNDALGLNAVNLAKLLAAKDIYFVPFGQDAPEKKPKSMVARMELIPETCLAAIEGKQLQPLIVEKYRDLTS
ncbi:MULTISPECIES: dipicolinate synthase subunit B [Thermoactinomyces]|uniref:Dipicolinate synthase subunit B n=2 Tax=Thermoactinomyces vulgaris TaxID=2026 RepID=A0ABS0QJ47_THEVU|nr:MULTISPECIES: dipicolinate synthase subunit B [Thermoactinomyces]MBH8582631.1 dipicolinate synthase subunit B [Thermoactinomyces sp. CICC 10735]MBH8587055.1 dipicolinate synthase subunit B [Thermoactinomyces sp. CICC 10520]MBI0392987.1 dipicolinate synthase subunit B [Thermoactinomyces sp. CICC 24226]KFZ40066.1 dipicolinate synthase subunit B [Thermoactinomyces sp. Gus2-1]MBA4552635.1 dipicolinate synthase subunit B [Thermoactinomyces vulgaris]